MVQYMLYVQRFWCFECKFYTSFTIGKKTAPESVPKAKRSICYLFFSLLLKLLLLLIVGVASVIAVCQLTELRKEAFCVPLNVHFEETVRWAQGLEVVQQVIQKMSDLRT